MVLKRPTYLVGRTCLVARTWAEVSEPRVEVHGDQTTTGRRVSRIASSVAYRSSAILGLHGVREFQARVVTCKPRQRVKTWRKLERALLLTFRDMYGEVPWCNSHGRKMKEKDEFEYFRSPSLRTILEDLS